MAHQPIIVWDLETVPDLPGFAAANNMVGASTDAIRTALGDKFPKLIYHSIVCIGAVIANREQTHWKVTAIAAPHVGERTEKQLISGFVERIAEWKPLLVTFNGNGFDLPVLRYRAMIHKIAAPGLSGRPYFNRYTEDAIDLCDVLSSFSPSGRVTLDEMSRIFGTPGKPDDISGKDVERLFLQGKIQEIANYCETDVVNTYRVWLRHELFRGKLSQTEFEASEADLIEFIRSRSNTKPHLQRFVQPG